MTHRRRIRLSGYDYSSSGAYLVTVCTRDRAWVLGRFVDGLVELTPIGYLVDESCRSIPSHHPGWDLDVHVVMPDHVHAVLIANRAGQVRPLQEVVGAFKAQASRRAGLALWQRSYHDRIIRNEAELRALREYIATNPLRWSLRYEGGTGPAPTPTSRRPS